MGTPPIAPELATLKARLLGPAEFAVGDRILTRRDWPGRKARSLLLVMLNARGHQAHREQIIDMLWPELEIDAGANALYKALHALRRVLEPNLRAGRLSRYVVVSNDIVGFAPDVLIWTDAEQFSRLLSSADDADDLTRRLRLRQALELHRGEYIADEPYADWAVNRREALRAEVETATLALADLDRIAGEPLSSVPFLERLLTAEPTSEAAHRALMLAHAAGGQRHLALRQFERCRDILGREFGAGPEGETLRLAEAIRDAGNTRREDVEIQAVAARYGSIPALPTLTIGRKTEIAGVSRRITNSTVRLLTIIGTGGVGKTRLATEVANRVKNEFTDGAGFVPLAHVRDSALMFDAIVTALRLYESPTRSMKTIATDHLRSRNYLLVLDNLEQMVDGGLALAELLEACPGLTILATSRTPLRIRAEQLFRLGVLGLPESTGDDEAHTSDATDLFRQVMQAVDIASTLETVDAGSIADLCVRLEGLPLAIELAAARCYEMSPVEILDQINQRNRVLVLSHGPRDLPDRHQTIQELVLWSYDLLPMEQQALFRHLSVFVGGAEVDALEAVGGEDAIALANALADANLAQWTQVGGERRLVMLETIREVAHLLLVEADELDAYRQRHALHLANLARAVKHLMPYEERQAWYLRLDRDIANLRQALDWLANDSNEDIAAFQRLALGTSFYWMSRRRVPEALDWNRRAFERTEGVVSQDTALLAYQIAHQSEYVGDEGSFDTFEEIARYQLRVTGHPEEVFACAWLSNIRLQNEGKYEEAIAINREALDRLDPADLGSRLNCLNAIGNSQWILGRTTEGIETFVNANDIARERGDQMAESVILLALGELLLDEGDLDAADSYCSEAERLARLAGNQNLTPSIASLRSTIAFEREDYDGALRYNEEARRLLREGGDNREYATHYLSLGSILLARNEWDEARLAFAYAVERLDMVGAADDVVNCAREVGALALAIDRPDLACLLLSAAQELNAANGWEFTGLQQARFERVFSQARDLAGAKALEYCEKGTRMEPGEVMKLAAEVCAMDPAIDALPDLEKTG